MIRNAAALLALFAAMCGAWAAVESEMAALDCATFHATEFTCIAR